MNNIKKDKIIFRPYKFLKINDKKYIYICDFSGIYKIDEDVENVLKQNNNTIEKIYINLKDILKKQKINEILENLRKFNIIEDEKYNEIDIKLTKNILSGITLMLCQDCNMRCSYCFAGDGEYNDKGYMSIETGKNAIDFLVANSRSNKLSVCLFGGEPLLNINLFKEMVNYCKYIEKEKNKTISITTTINGTLLTKDVENFLLDNNVIVQVSLDGDKKTHNSNRYFTKKIESYDKIMKNINTMREKGVLSARATVTKDNLDMIQIFNQLYELNFRSVPFTPAFNLFNNNNLSDLQNSYEKIIDYFEKLIKDNEIDKAKKVAILYSFIKKIHNTSNRDIACGLGNSAIAVDINGNIYPCHRFVSDKSSIIGNIYKGFNKRQEFLKSVNVENIDKCKSCWAKNLCVGGCPKELKENMENKDENKLDLCEIHKLIYEKLLYLYLRLTNEEKEKLFNK